MPNDIADPISETLKSLRLADEIRELQTEIKRLNAEVSKAQARSEIAIAALTVGVPPSSLEDVVSRAEKAGDQLSVVGPAEWVKSLRPKAAHLFASQDDAPGTTAQPTQPTGGGGGHMGSERNPWSKDGWDDMAQAAAYRADPVKAEQLAKAAGSRIGALRPS